MSGFAANLVKKRENAFDLHRRSRPGVGRAKLCFDKLPSIRSFSSSLTDGSIIRTGFDVGRPAGSNFDRTGTRHASGLDEAAPKARRLRAWQNGGMAVRGPRMTSNLSKALCVVGLSTALTAAASRSAALAQGGEREIAVGAIVPSSGPFAEWGRTNTVTLQMLEKQVNDAGGDQRRQAEDLDLRRRHAPGAGDQRAAQARRRRQGARGRGSPDQQRGGGDVSGRQRDEGRLDVAGFLEARRRQGQPALGVPQHDR